MKEGHVPHEGLPAAGEKGRRGQSDLPASLVSEGQDAVSGGSIA